MFMSLKPAMHLKPWVEAIWYSRGHLSKLRERVLPSATTDIIVNLGPPIHMIEGNGPERIEGTTVSGLLTRPILIEHPPWHEALGLRLSPLGIRAVLGIPGRMVLDDCVALTDLTGRAVDELAETLGAESDKPGRMLQAAVG
ncbi:MAG: DUF6597 domain-containing transcriptional factor, partial [Myxococcota bacterium]